MIYGIERYQDVLYNMYRASFLTKEEYEAYKDYDIKQDFIVLHPLLPDTKDTPIMKLWRRHSRSCLIIR